MSKISAAILKCDDVLDQFESKYGSYPDMIEKSFVSINSDISFDVYDVHKGSFPADFEIRKYRFFVITGSRYSVYEELDWITKLITLIQKIDAAGVKLFGICFGHQAIAIAKGCEVSKSTKGWGVGVAVNAIEHEAFFGNSLKQLQMLVSHQDQVDSIAAGARVLANSDFCPFFMIQWSHGVVSVQGHPEWVKGYSRDLMNNRRDRIGHDVIENGIASLGLDIDNKVFNEAVLRFLLD